MSRIKEQRLQLYKDNLKFMYTRAKDLSNRANGDLYTTVLDVNKLFEPTIKQVAILSDMVLDMRLLNKDSTNKFSVLNKDKVVFNKDIEIESNRLTLKKSNEEVADINALASSIRSFKDVLILSEDGRLSNLQEMLRYRKITRFEHGSIGYDTSITLRYNTVVDINNIEIDLGELVSVYPELSSVTYLDLENRVNQILINGQQVFRFNNKLSKSNLYKLSIDPIKTQELTLTFSSAKYSYFELESIRTTYNSFAETGEIILGPFTATSPILKVSLEGNKTKGCSLFISSNTPSDWIPFETVQSVNFDNKTKVASFNTINNASFKTEKDVTSVYLRVILSSYLLDDLTLSYKLNSELNRTTEKSKLLADKYSEYEEDKYSRYFGGQAFIQNGILSEANIQGVSELKVNNTELFKGLVETDYSYTSKSKITGNLLIKSLPWKISDTTVDADKFDLNGKIYSVRVEELNEVDVLEKSNLCFPLIVPEGLYTLEGNSGSIKIDCYVPFLTSSSSATIFVPYEDLVIRDQAKVIIKRINKDELKSVKDLSGKDVYFVTLLGLLYSEFNIADLNQSYLFPNKPLLENEFAIQDGKLISNKQIVVVNKGYSLIKTEVKVERRVNYTNGNFIKVDANVLPSHFTDLVDTNTQVVNLSKIGILKGSLQIKSKPSESEIKYNPDLTPIVNYINIGNNTPVNVTDINFLEV